MRLSGIMQISGLIGSHSLLRFDGALFEDLLVMIRGDGGVVGLILEHLNLWSSTLLSSLPSFHLVRGRLIISVIYLFALLIEIILKVFWALVHIKTFLHLMEIESSFGHC